MPEGDYYRVKTTKGSAVYRPDKENGKYKIIRYKEDVCYTQNMLFPRMWNERMAASYKNWTEEAKRLPRKKKTSLISLPISSIICIGAISYGTL